MEKMPTDDFSHTAKQISEIKSKVNKKILTGEHPGRLMKDAPEDFSFFEDKNFKKRFIKMIDFVKKMQRGEKLVRGFMFFGSWVSFTATKESDFDICLFGGKKKREYELKIADDTSVHCIIDEEIPDFYLYQIEKYESWENEDIFFEFIDSIILILNGIPFGKKLQELQAMIIEKLNEYNKRNPEKFKIFWSKVATVLHNSETGKTGRKTYLKYAVIDSKPLTFQEFVERWESRCAIANKFFKKNNLNI